MCPLHGHPPTAHTAIGILHKTVEPEPDDMGVLGACSIGMKAEAVRQAIERLSKALTDCASTEPDGKMQHGQVESMMERIDANSPLLIDVLRRLSEVHFHRFCQLGMGLPTVVKKALSWIEGSTKACLATMSRVNKSPELAKLISTVGNRLLVAESNALAIYSGTEG